MNRLKHTVKNQALRKARVRSTVVGTTERPRLAISISNRNITAQIIDDSVHKTLVFVTTAKQAEANGNMSEKAVWIGGEVAKKAKAKKLSKVVFDRNGRLYHGRLKSLAEAAREAGLEF